LDIRVFNTNTQQLLVETVHVTPDGKFSENGDYSIAGVRGTASPIRMSFIKPVGSMTGRLFPTGAKQELLTVKSANTPTPFTVRASLIDASNPFIFVDLSTMPISYRLSEPSSSVSLGIIEEIRVAGAVRFGLARETAMASLVRATPKVALLYPGEQKVDTGAQGNGPDIEVLAFSMGKPHPSLQLTGAVCLGAALSIPGTVAWEVQHQRGTDLYRHVSKRQSSDKISSTFSTFKWLLRHPSGLMDVEVDLAMHENPEDSVETVSVFRTARRLFEGKVFYRL
jgi:2-methylaconitate cis-trans-isomerase PrpF